MHFIVSKLLEILSPGGFTIFPWTLLVLFAHDLVNMNARHLSKHDSHSGNQTSNIAKYWSPCQRILTDMIWSARLHFCYSGALSKSLSLRRVNWKKHFFFQMLKAVVKDNGDLSLIWNENNNIMVFFSLTLLCIRIYTSKVLILVLV